MTLLHTLGPWKWRKPTHYPEHDKREGYMGGFYAGDHEVMSFGDNTSYYPTEGTPPNEFDANLIAAAPELLAACVEFIRKVDAGEAKSLRSYAEMKQAVQNATMGKQGANDMKKTPTRGNDYDRRSR